MIKRFITILLILFSLHLSAQEQTTITIVFTSDVHGVLLPERDTQSGYHPGALARVATYIKEFRKEDPELILVDVGDTFQGNPLMYYAARQMDRSMIHPSIRVMNMLGYDAMAIGNHEFNFGRTYLEHLMTQTDFPLLSANILNKETGEPEYKPYTIVERKGMRIGILGLVTDSVPKWELPSHIENLKFAEPEVIARKYIPILRNSEHCDLVVVALHDGLMRDRDYDPEGYQGPGILISKMDGVDALLTGHVHRSFAPERVNKTTAATCPAYGQGIVRVELMVTRKPDGTLSVDGTGDLLPMTKNDYIDEAVAQLVEADYQATDAYLNTEIAQAKWQINDPKTRHADSPMVDLLHKAQLEATGADISLASLMPWLGYKLEPGPVTVRDMFAFYPYENMLMTIEVTGEQLRQGLEWSARYYDGVEAGEEGLKLILDEHISAYNVDNAAGVTYYIDPMAPEGNRIVDLRFGGEPVQNQQKFTLALNSYRRAGGGGYTMFKDAPTLKQETRGVREVLIDYIEQYGVDEARANNNWLVVPSFNSFEMK